MFSWISEHGLAGGHGKPQQGVRGRVGRCKAAASGVQHGNQIYAPGVSLCSFQGKEVSKLWKGGNWEAALEKPEFFCPWKSPYSHSSVLLYPAFSGRRQWLSSVPSSLPAFPFW